MAPPWAPPWPPLVRALSISIFPSPSPPPDNIISGARPPSPPPNNPPPAPPEPRLLSCDSISRFLAAFCAADCPARIKWSIQNTGFYDILPALWYTSCFMICFLLLWYTSCFHDILPWFLFKTFFLPIWHTCTSFPWKTQTNVFSLISKQILWLKMHGMISRKTEQEFSL